MSIVTKTGDSGTTGLMYNRRVPKSHPRVEACGSVDEVNTSIGLARALATEEFVRGSLLPVQNDLIVLMGELATETEDLPRYLEDGFQVVTPALTARLDQLAKDLEAQQLSVKGWATPGATPLAAALDVARTTCRRAERRVCVLQEAGRLRNPEILAYLNRLSDVLWLLSRWVETCAGSPVARTER
jgi:cob(I)alamin adenosyltransferase